MSRRVPAAELFRPQTTLEVDELVVAATFPTPAPGTGWAMDELAPARRLRAGGRRPHRHRRRRRKPASGRAAYLSCAPTPVVVDIGPALGGGGDRAGDRVRPRRLVLGPDRRHPRHRCLPPAPRRHAHRAGRRPCPRGPGPAPNRNLRRLAMPWHSRRKFGRKAGEEGRTVSEAPVRRAPPTSTRWWSPSTASRGRRARAGTPAAVRHAPPRPAPDRDPRRLRARRVRRLHGPAGWRAHPLVPDVRGDGRRRPHHHRRGARRSRPVARPRAAGVPRVPRAAVRLLHAGLPAAHHRPARPQPEPADDEIRDALGGNLCRCTGYVNIVRSVRAGGGA